MPTRAEILKKKHRAEANARRRLWAMHKPWRIQQALFLGLKRGDRVAAVMIMQAPSGPWAVMAVETPFGAEATGSFEQVFANHAHIVIAQDIVALDDAKAIGLRWARKWKRGALKPAEACTCGPIATATTSADHAPNQRDGRHVVPGPPTRLRQALMPSVKANRQRARAAAGR